MTMTFKEALIAHLQGETVEVRGTLNDTPWKKLMEYHNDVPLNLVDDPFFATACEYRLAPRTILVNGVEVPAPEKDAPADDAEYFVPDISDNDLYESHYWVGDDLDNRWLDRGLVYLDKESAIARAKAMLITREVK